MSKNILSFDIGIKNLAYCYANNHNIIKWGILNIHGKDIAEISENCMLILHGMFSKIDIDTILIENQPVQKNPTMKTIQILVYSYFIYNKTINLMKYNIYFVSASKKNKFTTLFDISIQCKSKYQQNKKRAIECTRLILSNNDEWLDFFTKHTKKDDLADSYLQLLSFINYTPVLPNPPDPLDVDSNSSTSSTSHTEICFNSN